MLEAWPAYLGYVISFLTIGGAWLAHNAMTNRLTRADSLLVRINLLLLLVIAFLPFPTKLIAEGLHNSNGERVFVTMYGLTLLTIRILGFAVDAHARHEHLYSQEQGDEELQTERRAALAGPRGVRGRDPHRNRGAALAVALYFGLAVFLVVPIHELRRLLGRSSRTQGESN